ncbi:hypothetical protein GCM10020000_88120 [Streptomyces olivoverticillatus]
MNPITERRINFLHWHRDGGLIAPVEFSAGTPYEDITTWRERVAANRGNDGRGVQPDAAALRGTAHHQRMAGVRAAEEKH